MSKTILRSILLKWNGLIVHLHISHCYMPNKCIYTKKNPYSFIYLGLILRKKSFKKAKMNSDIEIQLNISDTA